MKFRSLALSLRVFHLRKQHQQVKASASQEVGENLFVFRILMDSKKYTVFILPEALINTYFLIDAHFNRRPPWMERFQFRCGSGMEPRNRQRSGTSLETEPRKF